MSKKDDDNPLEEIQKQLRDLMKNKNLQVAFAPFMQSSEDEQPAQPKEVEKKEKDKEQRASEEERAARKKKKKEKKLPSESCMRQVCQTQA